MSEMEKRLKNQDDKRLTDNMNQHYTRFQNECHRYQQVLELYSNCVNGKLKQDVLDYSDEENQNMQTEANKHE